MSSASGRSLKKLTSLEGRASWRRVPAGIRIGGAFMALGLVLLVFAAIELFTSGLLRTFSITPGFLMILIAAIILGAFATTSKYEPSSKTQIISLSVAVLMVIGSRLLPNVELYVVEQFWLSAWGVAALLCGLVIRRSQMPKSEPKK
ncbi:hypothetical protein CDES_07320 [Corynebacterium deserti GIMN1.010]|uniref:Uncharacterized protein n=1 Tax=Corynebacterium deserti GIMN1.010 TaxID=931089 RepID=A0A0M4CG48_9CORY|nr:hypothetical protein [Corynebacterium deserti]ALC05877.1 hypothetical protein CDES_07320 [Corynebacterium deserti GIMN1.010]